MTAKRVNPVVAKRIREQLQDILRDLFTTNGPLVTAEELAVEHVKRNASVTAKQDVHQYGGLAVHHLRHDEGFAIVPVTGLIAHWTGTPATEKDITDTVAGAGAGGNRVGWYHATSPDDWLWVFYVGHQYKSGMMLVFHTAVQVDANGGTTARLNDHVSSRSLPPAPATPSERKVLSADIKRK